MAKNIVIDVTTQGAEKTEKDLKGVSKAVNDVTQKTEDLNASSEKMEEGFKAADAATGGLLSKLKELAANPYVAIIGAIVGAIMAFKSALASSQEGQEMWGEALAKANAYIKVFADFISNKLIKSIKEAGGVFEWINGLITSYINLLKDYFNWVTDLAKKIATLDFKGAFKQVADTATEIYTTVKDVVNDVVDGVKTLNEQAMKAAAEAERLEKLQNRLNRDKRANLIEESKLNRELAAARANIADATKTAEERQVSLNTAMDIANQIADNQVALKQREISILQQQQALGNKTIEDQDKLAQLEADLNNIYMARDNMMVEMMGTRSGLIAQIQAEEKARVDAALAADVAERDRVKSLHELKVSLMEEGTAKKLELLKIEEEAELEQAAKLTTSLEEYEEVADAIRNKYAAKREEAKAEDIKTTEQVETNKLALAETGLAGVSSLINENSKASKMAAIAVATIDTWRGAQSAFSQTPGGIIAKSIAAASAAAIGIANIMKIKSTPLPGGGGDSGGSTGSASIPKIVNEAPKMAYSTQTQEIKAYIVEDDINNNMNKQAKRESVSTL